MKNNFDEIITVSLKELQSGIKKNIPLEAGKFYCLVIDTNKKAVDSVLMEDALFNSNSAVLLPARLPDETIGIPENPAIDGLDMLVHIIDYITLEQNANRKLLITGHTDRSAENEHNRELSRLRANSLYYLLTGKRQLWVETVEQCNFPKTNSLKAQKLGYRNQDIRCVLSWISSAQSGFGWDCDPHSLGQEAIGENDRAAIKEFREQYATSFAESSGLYTTSTPLKEPPADHWGWLHEKELPGWGAVFDLFQEYLIRNLRDQFNHKEQSWRPKVQNALDWSVDGATSNPDGPFVAIGCGEERPRSEKKSSDSVSIDESAPSDKNAGDRRVEVFFFTPADLPEKYPCHEKACLRTVCQNISATEECPLRNNLFVNTIYFNQQTSTVTLSLFHDWHPLTKIPCTLSYETEDGTSGTVSSNTSSKGTFSARVPAQVKKGTLSTSYLVNETGTTHTISIPVVFGDLPEASEEEGALKRLAMLGYYSDTISLAEAQNAPPAPDAQVMAIRRMQDTHFLEITGTFDTATIAALDEEFKKPGSLKLQNCKSQIIAPEEEDPANPAISKAPASTQKPVQKRETVYCTVDASGYYGVSRNYCSDRLLHFEKSMLTDSTGQPSFFQENADDTPAELEEKIKNLQIDFRAEVKDLYDDKHLDKLLLRLPELLTPEKAGPICTLIDELISIIEIYLCDDDNLAKMVEPKAIMSNLYSIINDVETETCNLDWSIKRGRIRRYNRRLKHHFRALTVLANDTIHERIIGVCCYEVYNKRKNNQKIGLIEDEAAIPSMRNGYYQHVIWLGVAGYAVINHHDREIMLIDPWPSYSAIYTLYENLFPDRTFEGQIATVLDDDDHDFDYSGGDGDTMIIHPSAESIMDATTTDGDIRDAQKGLKRLVAFANFLRLSAAQGYTITGILLTHIHFDHTPDIPYLLELLHAENDGEYTNHIDLVFSDNPGSLFPGLKGNGIPAEKLPRLYADYDTMYYLKSLYFGENGNHDFGMLYYKNNNSQLRQLHNRKKLDQYADITGNGNTVAFNNWNSATWGSIKQTYSCDSHWYEIRSASGNRLYYDDYINEHWETFVDEINSGATAGNSSEVKKQALPGTAASEFHVGNFKICSYVWDHLNTGSVHEGEDGNAGVGQRITAFNVQYAHDPCAKRTFFSGSSGGMESEFTFPAPPANNPVIETDLLVQAIAGETFNNKEEFDSSPITWLENLFDFLLPNNVEEMIKCWEYTMGHLKVNDAVIATHWEDFPTAVAYKNIIRQFSNFGIILQNITMINDLLLMNDKRKLWKDTNLLTDRRFFILGRMANGAQPASPSGTAFEKSDDFEYALPYNASRLLNHHYKRSFGVEMKG